MQLPHYLGLLHQAQVHLAGAFRQVADGHADEAEVAGQCLRLAAQCDRHAEQLQPLVDRYGEEADDEPDRLKRELFDGTREGPLALLRDLHDLYLMAAECDITWTLVGQAARALRDDELLGVVQRCEGETAIQLKWLTTQLKAAAPQALVAA